MPTKRPDQLPEGEDFNFDDILMVEKNANSENRKLYKTQLRELMRSALQMDPERMGSNAVLGIQSKFDWLIEQMNILADANAFDIIKYNDYSSDIKDAENEYIPPTPSITPSYSPTPTPSQGYIPASPTPTPTITLTPSSSPPIPEQIITVVGSTSSIFDLPNQYLPKIKGYNNWEIVDSGILENLSPYFVGTKPENYQPSAAGEYLAVLLKQPDSDSIIVRTHLIENEGSPEDEEIVNLGGLPLSASLTFKIRYF